MHIKACLFDLDGVIVDTAVYHFQAWRRLANELGFDFTEHQNEQLKGISRMESLELILNWGNVHLSPEEKAQWAVRKNDWYLALVAQMTSAEILAGVVDLLIKLQQQNIKIGLGSASKNSQLILDKIGLTHFFDVIIDGNHITKGKPDPQVFQMGSDFLAVLPENCVVFEDAAAGVAAAKAAKMRCVGIGTPDVLFQADIIVPNLIGFNIEQLSTVS